MATAQKSEELGYIGEIPVRNLWLLMLYASHLFRQRDDLQKRKVEDNPDDIPDLVAEILARSVERRLRRNLSFGYQSRQATLSRVRGRIDHLYTERHQLLHKGLVACRFEDLTVDTPRNRYVRAALEKSAKIVRRVDLARRCRGLAASLVRAGVSEKHLTPHNTSASLIGHMDADERRMLAAAQLAFDLGLPTETVGTRNLSSPFREPHWIWRLYEKAIAGFYDVTLTQWGWRVHPGKQLNWPADNMSDGIGAILPTMLTDIVLDHMVYRRRIIMDTKFTSILKPGFHRDQTLASGHVYQIYAYLRSQEKRLDDPLADTASGMLLYPAIDCSVDEAVDIQGHSIRFATVNLAANPREIRHRLLELIDPTLVSTDEYR